LHTSGSAGRCGRWRVYARTGSSRASNVPRDRRGRARPRQRPRRTTHLARFAELELELKAGDDGALKPLALDHPVLAEGRPAFKAVARAETARLKRLARRAGKRPDDELLHRLRLRGKRARYALELASPNSGSAAGMRSKRSHAAERAREHQDAVEAEYRLRELAATTRGGIALALGRLVEQQRTRRRDAVRRFARAWTRFDEPRARPRLSGELAREEHEHRPFADPAGRDREREPEPELNRLQDEPPPRSRSDRRRADP